MLYADDQQLENVSTAPRRFVPKWPFLLGDVLLVVAALAVSSSAVALTTTQVLFCLGAVGLGAVIFVLPYVLESIPAGSGSFFASDPAESESAGSIPAAESEWRRQARAAAEAVEHAARANAALESSARRFDARFAPLVEVHQSLTAVVADLREATATRTSAVAGESLAIQREFERLRKEQAEKFKATEEKIAVLGETLAVLSGHLKTLSTRPAPSPRAVEALARVKEASRVPVREPSAARVEEPALAVAGAAVMEASPALPPSIAQEPMAAAELPAQSAIEATSFGSISIAAPATDHPAAVDSESGEEKSMLAKALARAQSSRHTPAVAGIIMARARRPRKSKFPMPVEVAPPAGAAESDSADVSAAAVVPASPAEREDWQSLTEGRFDAVTASETSSPDESQVQAAAAPASETAPAEVERPASSDTSSAFRRSARAKAIALRGDEEEAARKDAPVVFSPNQSGEPSAQAPDGPTQGELLAREADTIRKRRSSRSPVPACALTARVLIGIGNKPFVRGTGPGLSTEKGVPMEFVEIGQWRWVAPGVVKEPITLRILKNDEVSAEGDPIVLHPGQSLEVSPAFPN